MARPTTDTRAARLLRTRRVGTRRSLVGSFAWRSALAFAVAGAGLMAVARSAIDEHFRDAASFHAQFVADAVVEPLLAEFADDDAPLVAHGRQLSDDLRRHVIDEHVVKILLWDDQDTIVASDAASLVTTQVPGYLADVLEYGGDAVHKSAATAMAPPPPGGFVVDDPLRSFIVLRTDTLLVAEILQDPRPIVAGADALARLIGIGLGAGLVLLWALLLPIARRASRDLDRRARTDGLTRLPNRNAVAERLRDALARQTRDGQLVAVAFVDLDGFKSVNDLVGHARGDEVLRDMAERLRSTVRPGDVVARFAGDEFVVVLERIDAAEAAEEIGERMREAVRRPCGNLGVELTASIGISVHERVGDSAGDAGLLVQQADDAMYHVKQHGGDAVRVFDAELRRLVERRHWIERELRGVAARGELELRLQPFVGLRGNERGRVRAFEALLRWTHPSQGPIGPEEFIEVAERDGTIEELGAWVIAEACDLIAGWQHTTPGAEHWQLFVNVSARQLNASLLDVLDAQLARTGADASRLGVEITETALLHDDQPSVRSVLDGLRERGCAIAVDDFGTGYSSLSRLRNLPIDLLKLDKSFIRVLTSNGRDLTITTAVVDLARQLGITVLAEGVETAEQLVAVGELGFDLAQGYHLVRPQVPECAAAYLAVEPVGGAEPVGVIDVREEWSKRHLATR